MLLRSMMQAVYSPENLGHFGLAYEAYGHFTSPIRRYPDLLLHRVIRENLRHPETPPTMDMTQMLALGEHCSLNERRADEATRDVTAWLKCEYMQDHIGDEFTGVISAVTAFGFFVSLTDIFVEGLVHIRTLDGDYFNFDPVMHTLVGTRTGVSYAMGDKVQIKVAGVNLDERKMDFQLLGKVGQSRRIKRPEPVVEAGNETPKKAKKPRAKKPDNRTEVQKAQASTTAKAEPKAKKPRVKDRARVVKNKGKPVRKPKPVAE
jgi:ribonuclease R